MFNKLLETVFLGSVDWPDEDFYKEDANNEGN